MFICGLVNGGYRNFILPGDGKTVYNNKLVI
nr:MAG TPA: hypothetical protein [Caudoviricetes sp.]